jgi:putative flippase GtrA
MRNLLARLRGDERVRFVIVGGINTVLGYGLFALFDLTVGRFVGYLACLFAAYAIATIVAFILHRRFTFQVGGTGSVVVDFLRFSVVYLVTLALNTIALPLLVELAQLAPLVAQAAITIVATALSYVGHKFFSFRRPTGSTDSELADARNTVPEPENTRDPSSTVT